MLLNKISAILLCVNLLQGCVAVGVAAVAGGAGSAVDHRTLGNQIDDQRIELVAHERLSQNQELQDNANLQVVSVNGSILVVGQAPNTYLRDIAIKALNEINGVLQLHNQIRISNTVSITTKSNDLWLTSKVKVALLTNEFIDSNNIKVVTENGEVFLMGLVDQTQANLAVDIARNISGVNRVFKMFEYQ